MQLVAKALFVNRRVHRDRDEIGECVSAGVYTATLCVIKNILKGGGVQPPPSPDWTNFFIMIKCTPESDSCHSVCTLCYKHLPPTPCFVHRGHHAKPPVFKEGTLVSSILCTQ
jgi:hypothetical protein